MTLKPSYCWIGLVIGLTGCASVPVGKRVAKTASKPTTSVAERLTLSPPSDSQPHVGVIPPRYSRVSEEPRPSRVSSGTTVSETVTQVSLTDAGMEADNAETADSAVVSADNPGSADKVESSAEIAPTAYLLSLGNVLHLADQQNPNVAVARERINEAYARVDRAETLWLPSLRAGLNYNHHEGAIQDVAGEVFNTTRSSFYGGMGAAAVGAGSPAVPGVVAQFHLTDAVFQPKIAAHQASARQFGATAARNDTLRDAAVAYLELVRAEHALAIAREALENTETLTELTRQYSETGQGLPSDHQRSEAELALRQEELVTREEGVQVASARLAQLLHADPSVVIQSGEPVVAPLEIVSLEGGPAAYVATGLSRRPELAEQKHLVCEAVERLSREKYAPLIPSVLLGMSYGGLGGGLGSSIVNTDDRWDADAVAYWEVRNLGFGERAARDETSSLRRQAQMRVVAIMDRVSREVVEAHAQVTKRQERVEVARRGVRAAQKSYALNLQRIENAQGLPIETLQAIQALANAQRAYLNAVVDYNVAQFELCRAMGWFVET
jgi:outer membrane protein TolC